MSWATASNLLDVCGAEVATCIRNALKRQRLNLRRAAATAAWEKERSLAQRYTEAAAMRKKNCKGEDHCIMRNFITCIVHQVKLE
jgi:hypothetical protein